MTEAMREQFEARFTFVLKMDKRWTGEYVALPTQNAWEGFEAGYQAALRSPAVAGLVEALEGALKTAEFEKHAPRPWHDKAQAALAQYATLAGEKA